MPVPFDRRNNIIYLAIHGTVSCESYVMLLEHIFFWFFSWFFPDFLSVFFSDLFSNLFSDLFSNNYYIFINIDIYLYCYIEV